MAKAHILKEAVFIKFWWFHDFEFLQIAKFSSITIWKIAIEDRNLFASIKNTFYLKDITEIENESVPIDPDPNLLQVMEKFEISKPMTSFFTPNRLMTPGWY